MKKLTKILLLVLTVALLLGAFVVGAYAATDDDSAVTEGLYWKYTDTSGATQYAADFGTAVSGANAGSTIYLLGDYTITTDAAIATIDKEITVDLGGFRFEVSQSSKSAVITVATSSQVTFKNGAIGACINSNVDLSTTNYGRNYGLLNVTWNNAKITIEDVDTYIGTLVYSYGASNTTFTINGGNHHLLYQGIDWSPSLFCVRGKFTFEANDANFLVTYPSGIISGTTYKTGGNVTARRSTATFNNCYIEHTKTNDGAENASFIRQASNATYFYFNGCYIKGAFNPSFKSDDAYTDETDATLSVTAATSANFVFGEGTRWVESTSNITPSMADGLVKMSISEKATATFDAIPSTNGTSFNSAANPTLSGYTTANTTRSITCTALYATPTFKYTAGGVETYSTGTLAEAITAADAGTTIYAYKDIVLEGATTNTAVLTISKNITIDLQGKTLEIKQNAQNSISISSSASVSFKNGSLYAYNVSTPTKGFPAFTPAGGTTLTLENIKSYTGGLVYMYSGHNPTVNIVGGEHHMILDSNGAWNGLIEMRGYVTFSATDASFYIAKNYLIVACNYNDTSDKTSGHSFTFDNCNIVAASASNNIIHYMNSKTAIAFNGCYISASFKPTNTYSTDLTNGLSSWGNGEITLGQDTYIASGVTFSDGLTTTPDGYMLSEVSETKDMTMNYSSGTFGTDFATASSAKSITFTEKVANENDIIEKADFIILVNDEIVSYVDGTLADAIASADEGSTIQCLYPVEISGTAAGDTAILSITKSLTIDLNEKTFTLLQYEKNHIGVSSGKTVTFKNGTINAHYVDDETKVHIRLYQALGIWRGQHKRLYRYDICQSRSRYVPCKWCNH